MKSKIWEQSRQRLAMGFGGLLAVVGCVSCTASAVRAESVVMPTFVPYYAADVYNETGKKYQLVLRTSGPQKVEVADLTVEPFAEVPLYIHRVRVRCNTPLEASIDGGKTFRPLRGGNLCEGHDTGNRPMLRFAQSRYVEIIPVSVD